MKLRRGKTTVEKNVAGLLVAVWMHGMCLPFGGLAWAQEPAQPEPAPAPTIGETPKVEVQQSRKVAVFVMPATKADGEAAKVLQTVIREAVDRLVGVEVVGGVEKSEDIWSQQVGELLGRGDTLLNENPITNPEAITGALAVFQEAKAILDANPGAGDNRTWAHVYKGLAVASVMTGKANEGYGYMKTSLTMFPLQSAIEYGYNISVQSMYERIIQDQSVEASGELELTSLPPHAEVRIDGKRKGFADPIRVSNLPSGIHRVTVHMDGYWIWEQLVEVPSGDKTSLVAELDPSERWAAIETNLKGVKRKLRSPKKADPFVQSLKAATGASEALVVQVGVTRSGLFKVTGIQSGDGSGVGTVALEVARDGNFFEVLRQFVEMQFVSTTEVEGEGGVLSMPVSRAQDVLATTGAEELTLNPDAPMFETEDDSDSLLNQWWFWTAVGVGVAGAATAIAVPLALAEDDDKGKGPTGGLTVNIQQLPVP